MGLRLTGVHVSEDGGTGVQVSEVVLTGVHVSGVVLTGGSSTMQGMVELGEEIFHMPVRLGVPRYSGGLSEVVRNPRYATVVGLLLEGMAQTQRGLLARQVGSVKQVFERMREWFQRNF